MLVIKQLLEAIDFHGMEKNTMDINGSYRFVTTWNNSTIRAKIKNFQSTENVIKLPRRGRVSISSKGTVRRRVWVDKDSPRITAGELQNIIESRG